MTSRKKKLFLISQNKNKSYDSYDSAVVCAKNENQARFMYPSGNVLHVFGKSRHLDDAWVDSPDEVQVEFIGYADQNIPEGVLCASFNAA